MKNVIRQSNSYQVAFDAVDIDKLLCEHSGGTICNQSRLKCGRFSPLGRLLISAPFQDIRLPFLRFVDCGLEMSIYTPIVVCDEDGILTRGRVWSRGGCCRQVMIIRQIVPCPTVFILGSPTEVKATGVVLSVAEPYNSRRNVM